jgi:predicted nucleotidyltransferase
MRDHRRRVEIRLIVVRTEFENIKKLVAMGRRAFEGDGWIRQGASLRLSLERVAYFLTDDPCEDGRSYFPREFQRANPRIPWKALANLFDRLHGHDRYGSRLPEERFPLSLAWEWATVRIPRIAHLLEHPHQPKRWYREPEGNLGIAEIMEPHRREIRRAMRNLHLRRLAVYGSVATGKADAKSDVDLLVEWDRRRRVSRFECEERLEDIVGRPVSIQSPDSLFWATKDRVFSELVEFETLSQSHSQP